MITTWSFSRWSTYDKCPRKAKFLYVDKLKEPESPAMLRGTRIHKAAEDFINGTITHTPEDLVKCIGEIEDLARRKAQCELEWGFTSSWTPTGWFSPDVWLRVKADAFWVEGSSMKIVDFKTGRMYPEHKRQLSLYALSGFIIFDSVLDIEAEDIYLDLGETTGVAFNRAEMSDMLEVWNERARPMLEDTEFLPKPGRGCRWCSFNHSKGGPCLEGLDI